MSIRSYSPSRSSPKSLKSPSSPTKMMSPILLLIGISLISLALYIKYNNCDETNPEWEQNNNRSNMMIFIAMLFLLATYCC